MMELKEIIELIKLLKEAWKPGKKLSRRVWKKVRTSFASGNKSIGFIRNPEAFRTYIELSQRSFTKKYSRYIIPTEYRGYLLQAIRIKQLYEGGNKKLADKKRAQLIKTDHRAIRLCNLSTSGMLSIVWKQVDKMIESGEDESAIIGKTSVLIDDLINNKAILYVNTYKSDEKIFTIAIVQFEDKGYCLAFGSGTQIKKVEKLLERLREHPLLSEERVDITYWKEGKSNYSCLTLFRTIKVKK